MRTTRRLLVGAFTLALVGGLSTAVMAQDDEPVPADLVAATEANETAYDEAFWAEDIDAVMATFTDDVVFEDQLFGDHLEGAEAVRGMYEAVFRITDPRSNEVIDQFISADGSRAVQILRWRGVSGSGRPFDIPTLALHEYRDGKIAREVMYYAARDAYAQLTQSPSTE